MVKVKVRNNQLSVTGHAGYAAYGQDIVCAAISALTFTLLKGLKDLAEIEIDTMIKSGDVSAYWQEINDIGKALIDLWFLGICNINQEYGCITFV